MKSERVSIITRTKDRAILLRRAIESVLDQRFTDWRMVVINDGGDPDEVVALVDEYRGRLGDRVTVLHHTHSKGMEAASNAGIRASTGEFVVIHDDDDSWHPDFLRKTVDYLDHNVAIPTLAGVTTHSMRVEEVIQGDQVLRQREELFNPSLWTVSLFRMASRNMFPPISFLYRRVVLDEIGHYREDLPVLGDWEFNLRFVARYEIGVIRLPLAYYHHRMTLKDGAYSNSGLDKHRFYETLLRNEWLRNDLKSQSLGFGLLANLGVDLEDLSLASAKTVTLFGYVKNKIHKFALAKNLVRLKP